MKDIDRVISFAFIIIAGIFYYKTYELPENSQMYPRFMIALMTVLTILLLIKSFVKKTDKTWSELFGHIQWKRFSIVFIACFLYLVLINQIGFFVTTIIYLILTMLLLKATRTTLLVAVPSFILLLYLIFKVFLKVPLPAGILI